MRSWISGMGIAVECLVLRWLLVRQIRRSVESIITLSPEVEAELVALIPETSSSFPPLPMTSFPEDGWWLKDETLTSLFSSTGRKSRRVIH